MFALHAKKFSNLVAHERQMQQLNKKIKKTLVNGQCVKLRFGGQLTHKHTHNQAAIHKQTDRGKSNDSWQEEQQQNTIH